MAYRVPVDRDKQPSVSTQECLLIVARLHVKIDVLRRAQVLAPELTNELQTTIDEIEQQLRALGGGDDSA